MRPSVGILISAWAAGITAGIFLAHPILLGACIVSFVALAYHNKMETQLMIACACVVFLGFLYGQGAASQPLDRCEGETRSYATVVRTYATTATGIQYVFRRNDLCTILVQAPSSPQLIRGTRVLLYGSQVHASEHQQENGIDLVDTNGSFDIISNGHNLLDGARSAIMNRVPMLFVEPDASLVQAMILGDTGMLSKSLQQGFRVTGITHILSISGLHIAIIIALLLPIAFRIPVPSGIQLALLLSALWAYIWAVGAPPSAIRSGVFWTLFTIAYRVGRLTSLATVVLLCVSLLATISPMVLRSVGFELSVTAMIGIWIATRFFSFSRHLIWGVCIVSIGATLGTLPIILYYFGGVSIISPLTNIVIVPIIPLLMSAMIVTLAVSIVSIPFALLFSYITHMIVSWMLLVVAVMQWIPYGYIEHINIPGWAVFAYYTAFAFTIICIMIWKKLPLRSLWV